MCGVMVYHDENTARRVTRTGVPGKGLTYHPTVVSVDDDDYDDEHTFWRKSMPVVQIEIRSTLFA